MGNTTRIRAFVQRLRNRHGLDTDGLIGMAIVSLGPAIFWSIPVYWGLSWFGVHNLCAGTLTAFWGIAAFLALVYVGLSRLK